MTGSGVYENSPLVIKLRARTDAATVIAVAGELDMTNCAELRRELADLIARNTAEHVALDLSEVTFLSSAGIGVLLHARSLVQRQGGRLAIVRAHENVCQVLAVCGLTALFHPSP